MRLRKSVHCRPEFSPKYRKLKGAEFLCKVGFLKNQYPVWIRSINSFVVGMKLSS